jgi:hypothetical protein
MNTCGQCIKSSCDEQLTALGTELMSIRTAEQSAFACVVHNKCLSLFWADRDAGVAAAKAAVKACIAACDMDAGVPDRDAARSAISSLAEALDACVDTSCASACQEPPDVDGGR